jgi:hypothetical protein
MIIILNSIWKIPVNKQHFFPESKIKSLVKSTFVSGSLYKASKTHKSFCLCGLYSLIFLILEIKTKKFKKVIQKIKIHCANNILNEK